MRRLILLLALLVSMIAPVAILSGQAVAVDIFSTCGSNSAGGTPDVCGATSSQSGNSNSNNPIVKIIKAAIDIISYIIGAAAIIGILASAIRMVTAGGSAESAASARSGLIYSLIGILVAVLAQGLVFFVINKIG